MYFLVDGRGRERSEIFFPRILGEGIDGAFFFFFLYDSGSVDAAERITALHGSKFVLNSYIQSCVMQELKNCFGDQFMLITVSKQRKDSIPGKHALQSQDSHIHTSQKHASLQCAKNNSTHSAPISICTF